MTDQHSDVAPNMTQMVRKVTNDDVFVIEKLDPAEVKQILFILSGVPSIKEFIINVRVNQQNLKSPSMKQFEELVGKYVLFMVGEPMSKNPF